MSILLPPLAALRAFESAARLQSVSRAAQELHVTHGAISRHIRTLEQSVGAALFAKQGRGLVLTAAGTRLREASSEAFSLLGSAWAELRQRSGDAPLVLGCSGSLLARWIIPRLARLNMDLPDIRLHLVAQEEDPDDALSGLDAVMLLATPPWPGNWQVQTLGDERIGPVLSPRHPLAATLHNASPQALRNAPLLQVRSRPQAWSQWAKQAGIELHDSAFAAEFEHLYYLLEAANAGLGIAIAPQPLVSEDIVAGRLLAPWGFFATGGQWLLASPRRGKDPRVDRLAQWLQHAMESPAQPDIDGG
ncbi:LysR family transcriptional regulator [Xanthomonas populi]|uniref:Transcriptional regulator n=1 Tax=Xanthomonas populi TaxID=53414 RepID=A0A2S7F432_9XANT|nr:LysR family transcriptional regulator [Xanthomonas populi]PPV00041.1 transcriptional regulator [Xanthomonas populi]